MADPRIGTRTVLSRPTEAREANRQLSLGTARNKFYFVGLDSGTLHTTLDYSKRNIAEYVLSERVGRFPEQGSAAGLCTYGGRMAQALKGSASCFVATPGMGANFGIAKGPKHKNGEQQSYQAMHIVDDGENIQLKKFFEREYGASYERDDHLYMNYTKFLNVSLPIPRGRPTVTSGTSTIPSTRTSCGYRVA